MLELPEAITMAKQLKEKVLGKEIVEIVLAQSPHGFAFYSGDEAYYKALLVGKRITDAYATGGYVELVAEDASLAFHDGTNIRYVAAGDKLPKKHQLYIGFADGDGLVCTVQMYGGMHAHGDGMERSEYYRVALEKPNPLSDAFDGGYFYDIVAAAKPNLSVKGLIATEQRIPGVGNGCLQDILFHGGLHPKRKVESLSVEDVERLYQSLKDTLREMTEAGGRDTEKDLYGNPGGYRTILSAKTWKAPCPACGGWIERKAYMGGNVYYCPHCQPLE
ncbi:endonuclease VIII [Eubacteriales bacterium OttesenSCG-928-M02]|nr:endonuclease VIII [Eubacteriales bacterium OttesenSCG-928-M02]